MTLEELGSRLQKLEDREAIRELVARYGQVVDDRDLDGVQALFTEDAVFRTRGGEMNATGLAAVMDNFRARFQAMTASGHFVHDHIISLQSESAARGFVTSHAELVRNGESFLVAMRYRDQYRRVEDVWKFSERVVSFFYYVPAGRYPELLPQRARVFGYGDPVDADWPEGTDTYQRYERTLTPD
jgi:ketosteroid isomerase-like protein